MQFTSTYKSLIFALLQLAARGFFDSLFFKTNLIKYRWMRVRSRYYKCSCILKILFNLLLLWKLALSMLFAKVNPKKKLIRHPIIRMPYFGNFRRISHLKKHYDTVNPHNIFTLNPFYLKKLRARKSYEKNFKFI